MSRYIAIEGNIGAGKTTLATALAQALGSDLALEQFEQNELLPKFYEEPAQHAFDVEMAFLYARAQALPSVPGHGLVSDYFFGKTLLFASNNLQPGEMIRFKEAYESLLPEVPQPDMLFILQRPVEQLLVNIKQRSRDMEQNISASYLIQLQTAYDQFNSTHTRVVHLDVSQSDEEDALQQVLNLL